MSLRSKTQCRSEKDVVALNPKEAFRIVGHNLEPRVDIAAVDSQPGGQKVAKTEFDLPEPIQVLTMR